MKILHVVGKMNMGGTETLLMNIMRHMDRKEFHFDYLVYGEEQGYFDDEIRLLGGRIFPVAMNRNGKLGDTLQQMKRIMQGYDAVHSHVSLNSGLAILAAKRAGVPIRIVHGHTTADGKHLGLKKRLYRRAMGVLIDRYATEYCACSKKAATYLFPKQTEKGVYRFVPNFIDFEPFLRTYSKEEEEMIRRELALLNDEVVIGHVGRFGKAKNQAFLVDVFREFLFDTPNAVLLLVGGGDEVVRQAVAQKSAALGISGKVRFLGVRSDIPRIMNLMDVFVLPSNYEGLGMVLIEAQATGLPCLVSEAIQPEADIGLGLVHMLRLSDGAPSWAKFLRGLAKEKRNSKEELRFKLHGAAFSIEHVDATLKEIYTGRG